MADSRKSIKSSTFNNVDISKNYSIFSGQPGQNDVFEVIGESPVDSGIYVICNKRADAAPNNLVWKRPNEDRFIFNTGSEEGWKIGNEKHLRHIENWSNCFFRSKKIL